MGGFGLAEEEAIKPRKEESNKENEEEQEAGFEDLGLDEQLIRGLRKKGITAPTPIQREAIPLIRGGKDVVARAKTGSGKTYAYLLPMLHELLKLSSENRLRKSAPNVFILVPTQELLHQVYSEALSVLEFCTNKLKVVRLTTSMPIQDMSAALAGPPNIVVTTLARISTCISKGLLQPSSIKDSLSMLILDEADLLLSFHYEDDLKAVVPHIPRNCQCILMSATASPDVEKLKKLLLHNPVMLTVSEASPSKDEIVPSSVQQFWIPCRASDKLLYVLALLQHDLVQKKVLIFVNSIDAAFKLRLFLEQFRIKSAVLNAELPQNSRLHIIEEFNAGLFDYLIATDVNQQKGKEQPSRDSQIKSKRSRKKFRHNLDAEFGAVRGIDFKNVFTVINFNMPRSPAGYVHRIGRTGRAHSTGASVSLVSPEEEQIFGEIKHMLVDNDSKGLSECIAPFPQPIEKAVESLRYRAQDFARSVTSRDVQEARRQDLMNEILNSEKLKAHFEENPRDLDLLKHDKALSKKAFPTNPRIIPNYLVDPVVEEASKMVKLSRAAMGINAFKTRPRARKRIDRISDPLKTFSADGKKKPRGGKRRKDDFVENDRRKRRKSKESI